MPTFARCGLIGTVAFEELFGVARRQATRLGGRPVGRFRRECHEPFIHGAASVQPVFRRNATRALGARDWTSLRARAVLAPRSRWASVLRDSITFSATSLGPLRRRERPHLRGGAEARRRARCRLRNACSIDHPPKSSKPEHQLRRPLGSVYVSTARTQPQVDYRRSILGHRPLASLGCNSRSPGAPEPFLDLLKPRAGIWALPSMLVADRSQNG